MTNHTPDTPLKQCARKDGCVNPLGSWLPATREHFYQRMNKEGDRSFHKECRACTNAESRAREATPEGKAKKRARRRRRDPEKVKAEKKRSAQRHPESGKRRNDRYYAKKLAENPNFWKDQYQKNKVSILARCKKWQKDNPERVNARNKAWRIKNIDRVTQRRKEIEASDPERFLGYRIRYRANHADELRQKRKEYDRLNPEGALRRVHIRRARKNNLGGSFTVVEWRRCLEYFEYKCAVCGKSIAAINDKNRASQDHWIPLSYSSPDNPGHTAKNIVPLCFGLGGCNESKGNKLPEEWLRRKFPDRAAEILARIEAYFHSLT